MSLCLLIGVAFLLALAEHGAADNDLQQQNINKDYLNPLKEHDGSVNEHEKRTIFGPIRSGDWAKHVVINKAGIKQVVGYSPIDYKFSSVVRPLAIQSVGYRYPKPQVLFRVRSPVAKPLHGGWKPVSTAIKPIPHADRPTHIDVIHNQPVPHVDHVEAPHAHVDHVHQVPVNHVHQIPPANHIHLQQIPVQSHLHQFPLHIDQLHQVNVPHQGHIDAITHVDHLHPLPAPQLVHVPQLKPFVPSPVLFEVTKPNLGVLPLGATFPAPVLREVPHLHLKPAVLPVPQPIAPPAPLLPFVPQPIGPQPINPQSVPTFFEYHGTRNYLPIPNGVPFLQQSPSIHEVPAPNLLQSVHPHQHLPVRQHDHLVPNFIQQQLPVGPQAQLQQEQADIWQQIHAQSQDLNIPQQQLPLEAEGQTNFEQHNVIQPGHTDVQIPFHLPQHPSWNQAAAQEGYPESARNFEGGFRPSVSLEPPYHK